MISRKIDELQTSSKLHRKVHTNAQHFKVILGDSIYLIFFLNHKSFHTCCISILGHKDGVKILEVRKTQREYCGNIAKLYTYFRWDSRLSTLHQCQDIFFFFPCLLSNIFAATCTSEVLFENLKNAALILLGTLVGHFLLYTQQYCNSSLKYKTMFDVRFSLF